MKFAAADFRPITVVMITGLAFSIILFLLTRGYYFEADRQQFQLDTANYGTNFTSDVDQHVNSLAAIRAFVSTSDEVTRWEFSNFAHEILPRNSGFKAVFWLPHIGQAQRKAFEVGLQRDGLFGLRLREMTGTGQLVDATARPVYLPVTYVEPFESTSNLLGVDLLHSPIYGPLFEAAEQAGKVVVSEPIDHALVGGAVSPMVLVVYPLMGEAGLTEGAASKEPQGYVLGVLQLNHIIEDSIGPRAPVRAAIAYGPSRSVYIAGAREQVMDLARWFVDAEFRQVDPFTVAGKQFYLAMRVTENGSALTRLYAPAGVAALVLALTILLAQSMLSTTMRKREVERAVLERTSELRHINDVLNVEVGQRRQAEADLRLAKEKAEDANRAKSAFLSTMSHELRTPLNAIIGFSSLLVQEPDAFNDRSDEYLHEINDSGVRLLNLINDILEITQMDTEETGLGQPIYLSDIVDTVMVEMRPLALESGINLQSNLAEPLPALHGDGKRLKRALLHLVSNAVKFTERGGWAKIAVHSGTDGLAVEVSDNGVGMPPAARSQDYCTLFAIRQLACPHTRRRWARVDVCPPGRGPPWCGAPDFEPAWQGHAGSYEFSRRPSRQSAGGRMNGAKPAGVILVTAIVVACAQVPKSVPQQSVPPAQRVTIPKRDLGVVKQPPAAPKPEPGLPTPPLAASKPEPGVITDKRSIGAAQRTLNQLGYNAGKPDGIVGPDTRQAIRAFQKDRGLVEDGRLTLSLAGKLEAQIFIVVRPGDLLVYADGETETVAVQREVQWNEGNTP